MKLDAESYLRSGSNELRVLEYTSCGHSFGINILKVQKIVSRPECLTAAMNTHPCVLGMFKDNNTVIPLIDLGYFLGFEKAVSIDRKKVVITEFFNSLNAFLVDTVEWIHHFMWGDVINANDVLKTISQKYIISIVKPDGQRMVPLLDYESIILDLSPGLGSKEMQKISGQEYDGAGKRILIAEDSPSVRNMLVAELLEKGFDVVSVADGQEAFKILKKDGNFDLVISDVEMPQMDGLALTTAIRNDEQLTDMRVIVYSSIGDMGMKARAEFLKADAHVTKLNVEELMEKVIQLAGVTKIANRPIIDTRINSNTASAMNQNSDHGSIAIVNQVATSSEPAAALVQANETSSDSTDPIEQSLAQIENQINDLKDVTEAISNEAKKLDGATPETLATADQSQAGISPDEDDTKRTIIFDAGNLTVASAANVTIVDAQNVYIENQPNQAESEPKPMDASPEKKGKAQKKNKPAQVR